MQICWSCKLWACDAKSLRILVPSREEVILDLQRSRQKDPIANQHLLSYFFLDREIVLPRAYIAQIWSFCCTAISEPFALVCHPLDSKQLRPRCLSYFRAFLFPLSLLSGLTTKFQQQDQNILNWIQRLHPDTHWTRLPLSACWTTLDCIGLNFQIGYYKRVAIWRCKSNRKHKAKFELLEFSFISNQTWLSILSLSPLNPYSDYVS